MPCSVVVETQLSQSAYKFHKSYLILKYVWVIQISWGNTCTLLCLFSLLFFLEANTCSGHMIVIKIAYKHYTLCLFAFWICMIHADLCRFLLFQTNAAKMCFWPWFNENDLDLSYMYRSRSLPRYIILYSMWQELSNNLLIGMLIAFMVMELTSLNM